MKCSIVMMVACALVAAQATPAPKDPPPAPAKSPAPAAAPAPSSTPAPAAKPKIESLKYELNWATGLNLGEAILTAAPGDASLLFAFQIDASVPGFALSESAESRATTEFCSTLLYKRGARGKRKIDEKTEFDQKEMKATRTTEGGGKSSISTQACAKDALTFLQFLRKELAAGRLPAQQKVYYGGAYTVSVKFVGTQKVTLGGEATEAEKITATIKGAVSDFTADVFFAKDSVRTPLMVQVPLKAGKLTLELVR
jgi:hypothetical protein